MKNRRAILWLLLALAFTLVVHALLSYRGFVDQALVQRTSLLDSSAELASRLELVRKGCPEAVLIRTRRWRLVEPYSAIVDERAVLKLLDSLMLTGIEDAMSEQSLLRLGRTREDFGLADPRIRLTVSWGDGTNEVSFGSMTPSGDGYYAAVAGESAVYVVSSNVFAAADLAPEGFRRRSLFPVGVESVQAFDVKRGAGASESAGVVGSFMRFVRDGDLWKMTQPQEASASAARVRGLLSDVMSASAVDFVWPTGAAGEPETATAALLAGYGLDPESAVTVTVKCADGIDRQVSFGKEAKEGLVYALVQNASAVVTVPAALKDASLAGTAEFTDTRLFPLDESSVSRVSVTDGETAYLLAKEESGAWLLDAPVAAATDAASVSSLLSRLFELKLTDVATNGVTVSLSTNRAPVTVLRSAALGGFRLEDLRSREIFKVDSGAVRRLVVTAVGQEKPTAVVYDRDRRVWQVESSAGSGTVDTEAVESVVSALNPLRAEWIVKLKVSAADLRAYGLDQPRLTIAVDQAKGDSVRRNILIGEDAQGGRYATLGATDAVFVLSNETIRRLTRPLVKE